jgi:hypothetical protein
MAPIDRIETLRAHDDIVGLDFVYVSENQTTLFVYFHPSATLTAQQILGPIIAANITIYSPSGGEWLPVVPLATGVAPAWTTQNGRRVLQVETAQPGDFSRYRFRLDLPLVDPYFKEMGFSFKANCPSELDCAPLPHECPDDELVDYPVNYLARDFWSIRQALLDFAADRHPAWQDRLEADVGMMLAEVMSAAGDESAYYQDRVARECYFETATQRRSVRRHARMVDYYLGDGKGGSTWIDFGVDASAPVHVISAGTPVWIPPPAAIAGETLAQRRDRSPSVYEVGHGIVQGHAGLSPPLGVLASQSAQYPSSSFNLRNGANELTAYQWDDADTCLLVGSTSLYVSGHHATDLPLEDFTNPDAPGKWVALKTNPVDSSVPVRTALVRLIRVTDAVDPLIPTNITLLEWEAAQATAFEMEYATLVVRGNVVPATAGETLEAYFDIDPTPQAAVLPSPPPAHLPAGNAFYTDMYSSYAIERSALLFTLPGSEQRDVVSHGPTLDVASPEVRIMDGTLATGVWVAANEWEWKRAMLGVDSSLPTDKHFMLDDGAWRRIAGYRRLDETGTPQEFVHFDYANGRGATVQFGDNEFGETPTRGLSMRAVYRLGRGRDDNVSTDALSEFDSVAFPFILSATNPFAVLDAREPEIADQARHAAPQAFRAETFRAVRAEDYAAAVEKLDWVQRAGAQFRWTGSWLTVFATPDPKASFALTDVERLDLQRQLDRYRLAARDTQGLDPKFVNLDLEIHVCVAPSSYAGEVKAGVLGVLFGRRGLHARPGFFSPDNWTFGDPLYRANLEAAIQTVPGVKAVEEIFIRRRAWFAKRPFEELVYPVAADEIIRVENDPQLPERGAVRLVMEGGA